MLSAKTSLRPCILQNITLVGLSNFQRETPNQIPTSQRAESQCAPEVHLVTHRGYSPGQCFDYPQIRVLQQNVINWVI
jgi:hypothetical protein